MAIALVSLFSFYGCDDENKILSEENDKPTATDSIPAADSIRISIMLNCDSLLLYAGDVDTLIATVRSGDKIVDYKVSWSTDGAQVAVVDSNGVVTALSVGSAVITVTYQNVSATCKVTVTERPRTYENGFEYVDLGLSVNWATCNVGATNPWERGDYYAWGEIETKTDYSWKTYKWGNGSYNSLTKYNTDSYCGTVDSRIILEPEDDVAHVKWGGEWHMPTLEEQEELINNCTWTWTEQNGVCGYLVTSNIEGYTNRSIFLPVTGYRVDTALYLNYDNGSYWLSRVGIDHPDEALWNVGHTYGTNDCDAWNLGFDRNSYNTSVNGRIDGRPVRPVCWREGWKESVKVSLDSDSMTMIIGKKVQLTASLINNNESIETPFITVVWSSDNPSVATVSEDGIVTAVSSGTAVITASVQSDASKCTIVVKDESEIEHCYVDLGLSVKWATFNVGATMPAEYGDYYAWGEIEPKDVYSDSTYKWCIGSIKILTKYNNNSRYGPVVDNKTDLDPEDDVAHVKWGGTWRMPTKAEQDELCNNCTWAWYSSDNTEFNGVAGYKITSRIEGYTDRFIFLPAAGYRDGTRLYAVSYYGSYWFSSLYSDRPVFAFSLYFLSDSVDWNYAYPRYFGLSVRPVCP